MEALSTILAHHQEFVAESLRRVRLLACDVKRLIPCVRCAEIAKDRAYAFHDTGRCALVGVAVGTDDVGGNDGFSARLGIVDSLRCQDEIRYLYRRIHVIT